MSQFIAKKKASKNTTLIEAVLKYLNLNYDKDISLNSMADYISLSAPYLSKLFKDEIGENFLEYLTKMKIAKSKELLRQSEFKIAMIAEKVNLGNAQNFIRIFKKYEGLTPGQYRKEYIKESLNSEQ
jgi:YesN/AraC family two-component response regulator